MLARLIESLGGSGVVIVAVLGIVAIALVWIAVELRRRKP
jgi:hypothetical protein